MFGTNGPQQEGHTHLTSKEQQQQKQQHQQQQQQQQQLQQQVQKLYKGRRKPIDKLKQRLKEMQEKPAAITHAVASAHYLGKELNMKRVHDSFKHALLHVAPDYILLYYAESPCPPAEQGSTLEDQPASSWRGGSEAGADDVNRLVPLEGSMAVFSSGSVVFYGSRLGSKERDKEIEQQEKWLSALEEHVSQDTILDGPSYSPAAQAATIDKRHKFGTEEVKLQVGGSMKKIFTKGPDLVVLQQWDLGTTEILSRVMAQSVAIDVYTSTVDQMLWRLEDNLDKLRKATHQGPLQKIAFKVAPSLFHGVWRRVCGILGMPPPAWQPDIDQRELATLLTDASTLEIRLMSKLGLMDKSHTPWESDKHDIAWQGLRSYFDIEKRQGQVEKKMGKITTKTNDMLETRRSTQTHYIENVITILIAIEIMMSLFFHYFDGGMASNTASMASSMEQLVRTSNQLLEALGHQQAVVAQAVSSMQAVQQSLAALTDPSSAATAGSVQQAKLEQATSALAQAIEALKSIEGRQ